MDKKFLQQQKQKLEVSKNRIKKELESFAKRDKKEKGGWKTIFPRFDGEHLEEAADEVEEYSNLLSIEQVLEQELEKINQALEKIKKRKYGKCERCGKLISRLKLKVYPQAKYCKKCQ